MLDSLDVEEQLQPIIIRIPVAYSEFMHLQVCEGMRRQRLQQNEEFTRLQGLPWITL